MESFIQGFFQFGGNGHLGWCALNIFFLLIFILIFWLSRTEEVFIIGIAAYAVIFLWATAKFFGISRRGRKLPIDWALFSALMEFIYFSLFLYFSRRARQAKRL